MNHDRDDRPFASRAELLELDRQLERGSLFTQASLERSIHRLGQAESLITDLVTALDARGVVSVQELGVHLDDGAEEADEEVGARTSAGVSWPSIALRVDHSEVPDTPDVIVDCASRMHVCHAVCCKLKFPLSADEVDGGHVKWDIGHPYVIRQESSGYCTHNDTATGGCGVYADRPGICRRYSCANDGRIWKDFDDMVLNEEWLAENLGGRDLHVRAVFPSMEAVATESLAGTELT